MLCGNPPFPEVSSERLDLYFQRRYADERNVTVRHDGKVRAAVQVTSFQIPLWWQRCLCGTPQWALCRKWCRSRQTRGAVVRQALRKMYDEGQNVSFLLPHDEKHRKAIEKSHLGSFWTATHRLLVPFDLPENYRPDFNIDILPEEAWGRELWTFYNTFGGRS